MKIAATVTVIALVGIGASPALASFGGGKSDDPKPASSSPQTPEASGSNSTSHQEAERWYKDAFDDVQKAKADFDAKKDKSAEKRLRRAIERGERCVGIDSSYHEAWNLLGYASRKLKDYDRAVASYQRCLKLKPDYAPAREYLGEAYLEMGKIDLAREQLAALDPLKSPEEVRTLQAAIEAREKAQPTATGSN